MSRGAAHFLARTAPFDALPEPLVGRLAAVATMEEIAARGVVWTEGTPCDDLVVVRRGALKVATGADDGDRGVTLGLYGRGVVLGEDAVLRSERPGVHVDRATAFEESAIVRLPVEKVRTAAMVSAPFALGLGHLAAKRALRLERRLGLLLHRSAHMRLAALLQALSDDFGVRDSRGVIVNLKLTHRELAALIGVTRETVSVTLQDLRRRGIVAADGKRVVLLDEEAITRLASGEEAW